MSSRAPSPPPFHSRSNAQAIPSDALSSQEMAATHLLPMAPNVLPPAQLLTNPYTRIQPPAYLQPMCSSSSQQRSTHSSSYPSALYSSHASQATHSNSPTNSSRGTWLAAAPLDRLLQTDPYPPPRSKNLPSLHTHSHFPPSDAAYPGSTQATRASRSPFESLPTQDRPDSSRRHHLRGEPRPNVPPIISPTYRIPERLDHTPYTSAGGYTAGPAAISRRETALMTEPISRNRQVSSSHLDRCLHRADTLRQSKSV